MTKILCDNYLVRYTWQSILDAIIKINFVLICADRNDEFLLGIKAGITNKDWVGYPVGEWFPEQCLPFEDSLKEFFHYAAVISGTCYGSGQLTTWKKRRSDSV